jgi:hypothetical protein
LGAQRAKRAMYEGILRQKDGRYILSKRLLELGKQLVADGKIAPPHTTWSSVSKSTVPVQQIQEELDPRHIEKLESVFVFHPDLPDHCLKKGLFGKVFNLAAALTSSDLQDLQSVNKRKALAEAAISRLGFLFLSYKVEFWYWELIEMSRK